MTAESPAIQTVPMQDDLPITGMTCAACARRVQKQLSRAEGVASANVNFATNTATVAYDPEATNLRALRETVVDAGYGIAPETVTFAVAGADAAVEDSLLRQRGVLSATFDAEASAVRVEYLSSATDPRTLRRAIGEIGYRVRDDDTEGEPGEDALETAHRAETANWWRRFLVAVVFAFPVLIIAMSHGRIAALDFPGVNWLQLALTAPVVFYSGAPFYRGAWAALRHRSADMNSLIALGTG
ncbi:MAG: cation transporter, partial [Armatimonadetes bacterium]|nr:cation transporter [Armatimonadota bacterium]